MDEKSNLPNYVPQSGNKNPCKDPQYLRKQELLEECKRRVGTSLSRKRPLHIAILGPPGCGKSAFLNTIFASFSTECWKEHAKCGDFQKIGKQVTRRLKSYTKELYYSGTDAILMPTFLDMTGFENENTELNKELLNIILSGKMEENEVLLDVVKYGQKYGAQALWRKYAKRPAYTRVDRIIVVCSLNPKSNLPSSFLESIEEIASAKDKFAENLDEEVKYREERFIQLLGLTRTRFARVTNYCPEVDPNLTYEDSIIPSLDVPVLRLMRQVLSREAKDDIYSQLPVQDWSPRIFQNTVFIFRWLMFFLVVVAVILNFKKDH